MPCGSRKTDDDNRLVSGGNPARDERIGRVHRRHALEVDICLGELRHDIVDVIGHAPQDRVGDRLRGIAARRLVAMQFLNPFEIDDRHDADPQIDMLAHVSRARLDATMQALIKQQVGTRFELPPGRERARRRAVLLGLVGVMDIGARKARAVAGIVGKRLVEILETDWRRGRNGCSDCRPARRPPSSSPAFPCGSSGGRRRPRYRPS